MTAIHPQTRLAPLPEFDIFKVPATQLSVDRDVETEHRPLSTITSDSPITFQIITAEDEYLLLSESKLHMTVKFRLKKIVKATGAEATLEANDWNKIKTEKNFLHSLFRKIDITYNGKEISSGPATYSYRAFFENMIGYSKSGQKGYLQSSWFDDKTLSATSTDFKECVIDLIGKIHTDLTFQDRAIVGRAIIDVKLDPNKPDFYLRVSGTTLHRYEVSVEFIHPTIFAHRAKTTAMLQDGHSEGFRGGGTAKYPITRVEVKPITIPAGSNNVNVDNCFVGQMPRRIIFGMVDEAAFNGSFDNDPYEFKHNNLEGLAAYIDGTQYPNVAYKPDFTKGLVAREFDALYSVLNQNVNFPSFEMTLEKFKTNPLFAFNFSPDLSAGAGSDGHVSLIKRGAMRLQLKFKNDLPNTTILLIFAEFDNLIEVNEIREVTTDFN